MNEISAISETVDALALDVWDSKEIDIFIKNVLGFSIKNEDIYGIEYIRTDDNFGYTHEVDVLLKAKGGCVIQSFNADKVTDISADCVGLTKVEAFIFSLKAAILEEEYENNKATI